MPDQDLQPDIVLDLFRIGEGGYLWAPAHKLPEGVRPGDYVVVGDGCDAEPAVWLSATGAMPSRRWRAWST